jgi:hypothetical protein
MYQAAAPTLLHSLEAFDAILEKAAAHAAAKGVDESVFLQARLAPDMFPFVRQIQIATDMAKGGVGRLGGAEVPRMEDNEASFDELRARIRRTCDFIRSVPAAQVDGSEDRHIVMQAGKRTLEFQGQAYLLHFVIPNVYFHLTTAYALLRHNGVELSKADFLGGI